MFHRLTVSCDQFLGFWWFEFRHETFMFFFLVRSNLLGTAVYGNDSCIVTYGENIAHSICFKCKSRFLCTPHTNLDSPTRSYLWPYYLAFFPFFLGIFPSRESASAWPSRLTCSNSFVLLSNFSPQTLHCSKNRKLSGYEGGNIKKKKNKTRPKE